MTCENNDHDWHLRIISGDALLMCMRDGCNTGVDGGAATGYNLIGDEDYWPYLEGDFPVDARIQMDDFDPNDADAACRAKLERWIRVSPRGGTTKE